VIPLYKEPKNSPFVTNEQKNVIQSSKKRYQNNFQDGNQNSNQYGNQMANPPMMQSNPRGAQNPLVDLQVYEPAKKPFVKREVDPALFMPMYNANPLMMPPQYGNQYGPYMIPNQLPIVKNYSINVAGPTVDHGKVNFIFEDVLPKTDLSDTSNTLGERVNMLQFVRSIFIKHYDGEDIDITGKGDNSLLSYLKFMELNPYNTNHISNNPYKGLPKDMLIYNSCYPIKWDKFSNSVQCANNSVGMNIRIYRLTNMEYRIKTIENAQYYNYDVWREVAYYEYVRENIIKTNTCPNFVILYGYYICEKCNVDFDKILKIKGDLRDPIKKKIDSSIKVPIAATDYLPLEMPKSTNPVKKVFDVPMKGGEITIEPLTGKISLRDGPFNSNAKPKQRIEPILINGKEIITVMDNNNDYSGRGLIALTEACNYNLYAWASRTYRLEGNVARMVNEGYHTDAVWKSVLAQLMIGLYVLQIHNIAITDFDMENNVYIKDVTVHGNIRKHWKYIIDKCEYYIPNYGYLLMIDSNYREVNNEHLTLGQAGKNKKFKIYSNIFENDSGVSYNEKEIKDACFVGFKRCFDPNVFSNAFVNIGGTKPPETVLKFLASIKTEVSKGSTNDIGYYIKKYLKIFLNNRIGTYLKETEITNVRKDDTSDFVDGNIVVHQVNYNTYKFALFQNATNGKAHILSRNAATDEISEFDVPLDTIFNYSKHDKVTQNFKANDANLSEDELLEIYEINKN